MTLFHIYANNINVGDQFSALGIKSLLPKDLNIVNLYWERGYYKRTRQALSSLNEKDLVIIGGGGLFKDYFYGLWELLVRKVKKKSLIIWGVGVCDNKKRETLLPEDLLDEVVKKSIAIFVRDEYTKSIIPVNGSMVEVVGCPSVFIVDKWKIKKTRYLLHVVHPDLLGEEMMNWRRECKKMAKVMDLAYVESNHLASVNPFMRLGSITRLKKYYCGAAVVVSSRLHGVIFGSALGKPVIPISGDNKIEGYWIETLGGDSVLETKDSRRLKEILLDQPLEISQTVVNNIAKLKKRTLNHLCQIEGVITRKFG